MAIDRGEGKKRIHVFDPESLGCRFCCCHCCYCCFLCTV